MTWLPPRWYKKPNGAIGDFLLIAINSCLLPGGGQFEIGGRTRESYGGKGASAHCLFTAPYT